MNRSETQLRINPRIVPPDLLLKFGYSPSGGIEFDSAAQTLSFYQGGTKRVDINSFGLAVRNGEGLVVGHIAQVNAGMGALEFEVLGTGVADSSMLLGRWGNDDQAPTLSFTKSRDPAIADGTFAIVNNGDEIGRLYFTADDGTDLLTPAAQIHVEVDGPPGANDMPGRIIFSTTPDGAATVTEALRIDSSQNTILPATKKLYLDGGGNTYISEAAADQLELWVGGSRQFLMKTTEMVVNEDQADVDFRVESNDRDKAIYLDAGANVVQFKGVKTRVSGNTGSQHFETLVSAEQNITDNVATDVLRITIPNNEVSGQLHVRYVGGSEAGKDWNSGAIVVDFNRTTTVPAEAQLTQIEANRYNVTGGGTTSSVAWSLQLNGEGSGVTETIDLQVTIDTSDGSQGTVFYVAQFMTNPDSNGLGGTPPSLTEL